MDASWEHSDVLWSVPHGGHFVDIDERSSKRFYTLDRKKILSTCLKIFFKFGTVVSFSGQSNICLVIFDC